MASVLLVAVYARGLCVATLALVAMLPPAMAGVHIETGYVAVEVVDNYDGDEDCIGTVLGSALEFCLLSHNVGTGVGPGEWEIYAHENVQYAGAAVDVTWLPGYRHIPLLPDGGLRLRLGELGVENPVLKMVSDDPHEGIRIRPSENYFAGMNESGIHAHYFGPTTRDLYAMPNEHDWTMNWSDPEDGDQGIRYDRITLVTHFGDTSNEQSSDTLIGEIPLLLVENLSPSPALYVPAAALAETARTATPNVIYGLDFNEVQVTSDPDTLGSIAYAGPSGAGGGPINVPPTLPALAMGGVAFSSEPRRLPPPGETGERPARENDGTPVAPSRTAISPAASTEERGFTRAALLVAGGAVGLAGAAIAVVVLYRRIRDRDLENTKARAEICARISAAPGVRLGTLARELGLDRTTVAYHVRMLERARRLRVTRVGRETRLFAPGVSGDDEARLTQDPARHPVARDILAVLQTDERISVRAIATAIGAPESTVRWHLGKLRDAGIATAGPER